MTYIMIDITAIAVALWGEEAADGDGLYGGKRESGTELLQEPDDNQSKHGKAQSSNTGNVQWTISEGTEDKIASWINRRLVSCAG